MDIKVGDIAVIENYKHGIINCPIIYVSDYFIIAKSKFYNVTINITGGRKFNSYIDNLNRFLKIKKKGE